MNSVVLEQVVRARLADSMTTAGVDVQGVWSTIAPDGTEVKNGLDPFIVFELLSGTPDDTFSANGVLCTYRVSVYDDRSNGTTNAKPAYDAVIGDGKPDTASTRGLHRWKGSAAGLAISEARLVRFGYGHDGDVLHYWADFEIYAEEA